MPPPSRSPRDPSSVSPSLGTSGRQTYTTSAPHASRYPYQPQGNPNYLPNPTVPSSFGSSISTTASSGYNSSNPPMHYDASAHMLSSQSVPPFDKTKTIYSIYNGKGIEVRAELHAKIDKGFFKADQDWTCYRRNYFSVACWYTLQPPLDPSSEPLFLRRAGASSHEAIHNFAVCITARVNGEDGKVIDLVQHTPKRDKGPTGQPEKQKLLPQGPGSVGIYPDSSGNLSPGSQLSPDYEGYSTPGQQQNSRLATFDRIQFKNATANNGKRRAAQQYFHLVVELFAEIQSGQSSSEGQWIKIATRMSAPMVVRGRSPGHYSDDRRSSSTSMGPGGGSSGDSTGARDPSSTGPGGSRSGGSGIASFSGSSRGGSGGYLSHQATVHHSSSEGSSNHSSAASNYATATGTSHGRLPEPVLTSEEANNIEEFEGYQYYPSPLYEAPSHGSHGVRQRLPFMRANTTFKLEPHSSPGHHPHFSQVSTSPEDYALPRNFFKTEPDASPNNNVSCGRFQGVSSSRGYYPETPAIWSCVELGALCCRLRLSRLIFDPKLADDADWRKRCEVSDGHLLSALQSFLIVHSPNLNTG